MLATALLIAGTLGSQAGLPRAVVTGVPVARTLTVQRSGFPKLHRCASPIAHPEASADYSPSCLAWRARTLAEIQALPVPERIARVAALRLRMGVAPDRGLGVSLGGTLRAAETRIALASASTGG